MREVHENIEPNQKHRVLVSRIEFIGLDETFHEDQTVALSVNVFPEDAEDANKVTFKSSDTNVAEIRGGKLILTGGGQCEITARTSRASVTKQIVVMSALAKLKISQPLFDLNVGSTAPVDVKVLPKDAYNAEYRWHSSDKTVAVVVNEDGQEYIKGVGIGTCELACGSVDGSVSDTCTVCVNSIMYKKEKKRSTPILVLVTIALLAALVVSMFGDKTPAHAGTASGESSATSVKATAPDKISAEDLPVDVVWEVANRFAAAKQAANDAEGVAMFSYSDVEVCGIYFAETNYTDTPNEYSLHILISYDFYVNNEYSSTNVFPLIFEDIQPDSEGNVHISYEDGSGTGFFYSDVESYLATIRTYYTVTQIG